MSVNAVHITTVHPRDDVRIRVRECETLVEAQCGAQIWLVVADGKGSGQSGGIKIVDVGRPVHRVARMTLVLFRVLRLGWRSRWDLVHVHDPELLPLGVLLRLRGSRVVYDAHEDLPRAILSKEWIPRYLRRPVAIAVEQVENCCVRHVDAVVAATPSIGRRFGRVSKHVSVVQNFPVSAELVVAAAVNRAPRQVVYVGGIERIRGAMQMVRAMESVNGTLQLAGEVYPTAFLKELESQEGWRKVQHHGLVPRGTAQAMLRQSCVGLLLFLPEPNHVASQPNKLFEYMAAGLPVVASDFPLWREIITGAGCGLLVDPGDPHAIAAAINHLLDAPDLAVAMGQRGKEAVVRAYTWESQAVRLLALYRQLLAPSPPSIARTR